MLNLQQLIFFLTIITLTCAGTLSAAETSEENVTQAHVLEVLAPRKIGSTFKTRFLFQGTKNYVAKDILKKTGKGKEDLIQLNTGFVTGLKSITVVVDSKEAEKVSNLEKGDALMVEGKIEVLKESSTKPTFFMVSNSVEKVDPALIAEDKKAAKDIVKQLTAIPPVMKSLSKSLALDLRTAALTTDVHVVWPSPLLNVVEPLRWNAGWPLLFLSHL